MSEQLQTAVQKRRLWLAIAAILLILTLRDVAWREIVQAIWQLCSWELFVLVGANALMLVSLYGRWKVILHAQGYPIPFQAVAKISLAGFAVSYLTPGPQFGGEPVQVYLLHRNHQMPLTAATASVALDKTLTLLTSFSFLLLGVLFIIQGQLFSHTFNEQALVVVSILFAIPFILLLSWWYGTRPLTHLIHLAHRFSPRFERWAYISDRIEGEISAFYQQHPSAFALALVLSVVSWSIMAAEYWLMAYFLGLNLSPWQAMALLTAARLAFLLPLPGAVGTLEAAHVWTLEALGLPATLGISLSLLIHGRDLSLALFGLWWSDLAFGKEQFWPMKSIHKAIRKLWKIY